MTPAKQGISSLPSMSQIGIHPIERMLVNGELPVERDCVHCGCQTDELLTCVVQCEVKGGKLLDLLPKPILFLFAPIWFVPLIRRSMETQDVSAEDRTIDLAIRLCDQCKLNKRLTRHSLKQLVCKTQVYRELFEEFPNAQVHPKLNT